MGLRRSGRQGQNVDKPAVSGGRVNDKAHVAADGAAYHHGELPATLMALALEHIEAHGTEKLSLRALAREAGVSPTAPYRHFATKQCLLAALATQGFERLGAITQEAAEGHTVAQERLVAMAVGYVNFAKDNPTAYQLMFGSVLGDFSEYTMLHHAANSAYALVESALKEVVREGELDLNEDRLGGVLWAFVHGMASLVISEIDTGGSDSSPMRSLESLREDPEAAVKVMFRELLFRVSR